jgi:hypothetical protein
MEKTIYNEISEGIMSTFSRKGTAAGTADKPLSDIEI